MASRNYDNQQLTQYLLGALPEAQAEAFDELSFVDDDFVARLEAVENDLVDAYVRGEIAGRELAAFESHYLASPRRREKVAFAKSLQEFAAQQIATLPVTATASEEVRAEQPVTKEPWWRALVNFFSVPNLTLQWGMATAALVMLLAGGWFVWETMRLRGQISSSQTEFATLQQREKDLQTQIEQQRNANTKTLEQLNQELTRTQQQLAQLQQQELARQQAKVELPNAESRLVQLELTPQLRGVGQASTLKVPVGTAFAVMQLETEDDDYQSYQAEVVSLAGDRLLWKSGKLKARLRGNAKIIDLKVRANRLAPGEYVVRLKGVDASGQVEDIHRYAFKVVK